MALGVYRDTHTHIHSCNESDYKKPGTGRLAPGLIRIHEFTKIQANSILCVMFDIPVAVKIFQFHIKYVYITGQLNMEYIIIAISKLYSE